MKCQRRTFEVSYSSYGGVLRGQFLIGASNFRAARHAAFDYMEVCGLLPVEELTVRLKTSGIQIEPLSIRTKPGMMRAEMRGDPRRNQ